MYVVTYNKVTQICRESFCLSCIIRENTWENRVLYVTNDLYNFFLSFLRQNPDVH